MAVPSWPAGFRPSTIVPRSQTIGVIRCGTLMRHVIFDFWALGGGVFAPHD
jgi:hypothetical protein